MSIPFKRTSGQHHGDLRRVLEDAALELIAERGPRGFSLAEITRRAGVSVAAPYKHFADSDAVLAALAERGYTAQFHRFGAAVASAVDPTEQLAAFSAEYARFAADERALFEVTFRSGLDKALYPSLAIAGERVLSVLRPPAQALTTNDASAVELIYAVAASAHGYAMFLLEGVFADGLDAFGETVQRAATSARILAEARL
ncbi:MAG: TetR-family transcriptional regulator [Subtercola sp.]|nr:TetR-family transcriptional regulator [Subtercola sp.]